MAIGIFPEKLWAPGCRAHHLNGIVLPAPAENAGHLYAADLRARLRAGPVALQRIHQFGVKLLIDLGGTGLTFVEGAGGMEDLRLVHEQAKVPLVSLLPDPVPYLTQALPWPVLLTCLRSSHWLKLIPDTAHAQELIAFGVDHVAQVPMAALDDDYDTAPVSRQLDADVGFVGDSSHAIFPGWQAQQQAEPLPEALTAAWPNVYTRQTFFDLYHNVAGLAAPPSADDTVEQSAAALAAYFTLKRGYAAAVCAGVRDASVRWLAARFGPRFQLTGRGWEPVTAHPTQPLPASMADYLKRYRTAAININIWDGWAESSVNPHMFEMTAAGGFMLAAHHDEIGRYFEIGEECDTFRSPEEMQSKIEHYLAHPQRRQEMALAGQRRTLSHHLYSHRLQAILQMLDEVAPLNESTGAAAKPPARPAGNDSITISRSAQPATSSTWADLLRKQTVSDPRSPSSRPAPTRPGGQEVSPSGAATKADHPPTLLVMLNPGMVTRMSLTDMAAAAERLGIRTVTYEMGGKWGHESTPQPISEADFAQWLRRENVRAALSYGVNGSWEWTNVGSADGQVMPFFDRMGITHIQWWTDHPQWHENRVALRDELQPIQASPHARHILKSEMAAEEVHDLLGWPNCTALPVAEDPDRLQPARDIEPAFDVVAVLGSAPMLFDGLENFLQQDEPCVEEITDHVARTAVLPELADLWDHHAPADVATELNALSREWVARRQASPLTASYRFFRALDQEGEHRRACRWLRDNPRLYFEALPMLWKINGWQRTFVLRYLSRFFDVGVFGANWSSVGFGGSAWVPYDQQASTYARGRAAINIAQGNDEEGIAHKPFQIAASGVPMIHVHRRGLSDCFEPGQEVLSFLSPAEARTAVQQILEDPQGAREMAEAARERLVREHTWDVRLPQMMQSAGVSFDGIAPVAAPGTNSRTEACPVFVAEPVVVE